MHDVLTDIPRTETEDTSWYEQQAGARRGPLIAVPLYRTPDLLRGLAAALLDLADELIAIDATLMLIDDSADDRPLRDALGEVMPALSARLPVELVRNAGNLGFVRSANLALARARDTGRDALLLNSDALPRPGALAEMVAVSLLDPMIAVVSPRSDNATICNSPYPDAIRLATAGGAHAAHLAIERHLPRLSYVPTAVGFCLLVRHAMLVEFGLFDECYGAGYDDENDFVRRCNRRGYRAVLANHAYVHHLGGVSFGKTGSTTAERQARNHAILIDRYPEYDRIVARWFEDPDYRAQRLLAGLVPAPDGRLRLLFDCGGLRCFYNGTHEHLCALLTAFAARHSATYDVAVLCEPEAFAFHGLDRVPGLVRCDLEDARARPAAAVIRLGQPFEPDDLHAISETAPVAGVLMFDTIAMDCQHLDHTDLQTLWQVMVEDVDAVGFNSAFSRDQFARRFDVPARVVEFVSRCSTDVADYGERRPARDGDGDILLVGNHYPHKHVHDTLAALEAAGVERPVTVFGVEVAPHDGIVGHVAGDLPQARVDAFYDEAGVVLFPSHYEGFGLPILHALARRRPVIARDLPCAQEIRALCREGANLHLATSTAGMVALALDPPAWIEPAEDAHDGHGDWGSAADAVADAVVAAIADFDFATLRRRQARAIARLRAADAYAVAEAKGVARRADLALPTIGHGFMLAEAVDRAVRATPTGMIGRWARALAGGGVADVRVEAQQDDPSIDAAQRALLTRLDTLVPGASVSLGLSSSASCAGSTAMAVLVASGCDTVEAQTIDGGVVARGVYRASWRTLLPGPEDDANFVHYLYRQTLGRNPDSEGGRTYFDELQNGLPRDELVRLFLCSGERREAIVRRLAQRERPGEAG